MNERNFSTIPAAACRLAGGEVALGDNGEGAKTAPIKLKARSGDPIEHWYWGKVVHDLNGMRLHKPRLAVDYAHNDSEVLGYLNHFDAKSGDLIVSGALTPFREDDRASEVLFKMREGVPYEASIFFGGDGIKIEEISEGQVTPVNGRQFEGPGVVIREWPLRGVAICPYGADQNTESAAMAAGETYSATTYKQEQKQGETAMSEQGAVEVEAVAEAEAVEAPVVEAEAAETQPEPELAAPESQAQPEAEQEQPTEPAALSALVDDAVASLAAVTSERDAAIAERDALRSELDAVKAQMEDATRRLAAMEKGAPPVSATPAPPVELTPWQKAQRR